MPGEIAKLLVPTDEGADRGRHPSADGRCVRAECGQINGDRLGARVDAELFGQDSAALLVGPDRSRPIPGPVQRADQTSVRPLVQWVLLQQITGGGQRPMMIALCARGSHDHCDRSGPELVECLPMVVQPVGVLGRQ